MTNLFCGVLISQHEFLITVGCVPFVGAVMRVCCKEIGEIALSFTSMKFMQDFINVSYSIKMVNAEREIIEESSLRFSSTATLCWRRVAGMLHRLQILKSYKYRQRELVFIILRISTIYFIALWMNCSFLCLRCRRKSGKNNHYGRSHPFPWHRDQLPI